MRLVIRFRWQRLLLIGLVCLLTTARAQAEKPNILFIVADDLGWNDVGWHGAPIHTPNLDRLVREGVELDRHYVHAVCTPTRTALISGRYPSRFGPHVLRPSNLRAFLPGTETIASALRAQGYATYQCGKWHLGSRMAWGPNHYGFEHSYGSLTGAVDPWTHLYRKGPYMKTWHRDCVPLDEYGKGNVTELVTAQAVRWIRDKREPWFLYMAFNAVHIPVDAPAEYKALYAGQSFDPDPARNESRQRFAAYVTQLDAKVGELVAAVDASGQRANTLIVFTSDNGGLWKGDNPYASKVPPTPLLSSNAPLRGQKAELYEGGIRVPAFVNWPGRLKPSKVAAPLHAIDWFPTLATLVGWRPPRNVQWDGQNVWPIITGEVTSPPARTLYWPDRQQRAVRQGDWKLIVDKQGRVELFNLAADPCEKHDLATREPAHVNDLREILKSLRSADVTEIPADLRNVD
jgi:arylsulfatase A-like enzyme